MIDTTQAIPARDALHLQLACIAGNEPPESFLEIRCLRPDGRPGPRRFLPIGDHRQAIEVVRELRDRCDVLIGVAPRSRRAGTADAVARVWCLRADCDSAESVARLRRFLPRPSIVAMSGTTDHRHAYWPLSTPLPASWARAANLRLAHALRSDPAIADAPRVMRAIGSYNHKHRPAALVSCTRAELDMYTCDQLVGGLPDPPSRRPPAPRPRSAASPSAALNGLVRTIRAAQPGHRNRVLYWSACRVADRADQLDAEAARAALRDAGLAVGLREHEVAATLSSALDRAGAA